MVTRKKINIPIFDYGLTIYIYDSWDEVKHMFNYAYEPRGITAIHPGYSVVAINYKFYDTIVHEAEHIKNAVWEHIGYKSMADNDEIDAYMIGYIFNKIADVYNKHKESK